MITLVTGGARSGKSTWALEQALNSSLPRYFIATATAFDGEMEERIRQHKEERGSTFTTVEESLDLIAAMQACDTLPAIILLDCLTVWIGNLFYQNADDPARVRSHIDHFIEKIAYVNNDCVIVTNEVGMGIVPDNRLSRDFRDMQGYCNRRVAQNAERVVLMVSGIPLFVKQ